MLPQRLDHIENFGRVVAGTVIPHQLLAGLGDPQPSGRSIVGSGGLGDPPDQGVLRQRMGVPSPWMAVPRDPRDQFAQFHEGLTLAPQRPQQSGPSQVGVRAGFTELIVGDRGCGELGQLSQGELVLINRCQQGGFPEPEPGHQDPSRMPIVAVILGDQFLSGLDRSYAGHSSALRFEDGPRCSVQAAQPGAQEVVPDFAHPLNLPGQPRQHLGR